MIGRVRWVYWLDVHEREMIAIAPAGPALVFGGDGWYTREGVDGGELVPGRRVARRRSEAKAWLLARAAGLAEVPRASRPREINDFIRGVFWPAGRDRCGKWTASLHHFGPLPRVPRGWRLETRFLSQWIYQRNRRRT